MCCCFLLFISFYSICRLTYGLYRSVFSFLCTQVKAMRNFDINEMMGFWYVVQYYASSEEAAEYSCMKCNFTMSDESALVRFQFFSFSFLVIRIILWVNERKEKNEKNEKKKNEDKRINFAKSPSFYVRALQSHNKRDNQNACMLVLVS